MKIYKSKIGLELVIPLAIILYSIVELISEKKWIGLAIIVIVMGIIAYFILSIRYIIENENLSIKSGFASNGNIDIKTIRKLTESNNLISSPAASIDRIEILYNKFDSVLVSPKDKIGFIKELTEINPSIEVKMKKNN